MWTIATAFVNKPKIIPLWLECFKKLDFPRKEFELVWVDMTQNPDIHNLLQGYLKDHGREFKKVTYIQNPPKKLGIVIEFPPDVIHPSNFLKAASITETMNIINAYRSGNLLMWEEDVIVPSYAWKILKNIFDQDTSFKAVTGVQYFRKFDSRGEILAWNWRLGRSTDGRIMHFIENIREKFSGVEQIGASAQGFTLYREDFLNGYVFRTENGLGADIMAGFDIQELGTKPLGGGGKVILVWDMKFPHLGLDQNGNVKAFKSDLCTTPVPSL